MKTPIPQTADQHQHIMLLLPWYLNNSLQNDEQQQVKNHLRTCLVCRRELVALGRLSATVKRNSDLEAAAEASFAGLKARLPVQQMPSATKINHSQSSPDAGRVSNLFGRKANRGNQWLFTNQNFVRYLAIAASLLLAVIPLTMHFHNSIISPDYYTLSAARVETDSSAKLRVVFSRQLTQSAIDTLLGQIHGQLIEGPNTVGAYTIKLLGANQNAATVASAIDLLRKQPEVLLAEPVLQP